MFRFFVPPLVGMCLGASAFAGPAGDFAVYGPGIWPCSEYADIRRLPAAATPRREVLLWLVGYYQTLGVLDRVVIEDQAAWLDRYCAAEPIEPLRCAVDEGLRAVNEGAGLATRMDCRRATIEALRLLRDRSVTPSAGRY